GALGCGLLGRRSRLLGSSGLGRGERLLAGRRLGRLGGVLSVEHVLSYGSRAASRTGPRGSLSVVVPGEPGRRKPAVGAPAWSGRRDAVQNASQRSSKGLSTTAPSEVTRRQGPGRGLTAVSGSVRPNLSPSVNL